MKKSNLRKIILFIVPILLFAFAFIYEHIYGMSEDDVLNRTANFWIPTCLIVLALAIIYVDAFVDKIKKRYRLKATIQIIQLLIGVALFVYQYMIIVQLIPIDQQISEILSSSDYKVSSQLWNTHSDLLSKQRWAPVAAIAVILFLECCPYLIRKISNWVHNKMNKAEDQ